MEIFEQLRMILFATDTQVALQTNHASVAINGLVIKIFI
jgi:hypothetical protein